MRIVQLLPTLSYGDAIGNHTLAIKDIIKEMGYETAIYAERISVLIKDPEALLVELMDIKEEDVVIYHLSTGCDLHEKIQTLSCRKIMVYHNITPPNFFRDYDKDLEQLLAEGLRQVYQLANTFDYCLTDSEFNKHCLEEMGYQCAIDVMPIIIPLHEYAQSPDLDTVRQYNDDRVNFLFVGRIVPNKKQEDIIRAFAYYKKHINWKSRLFLVGNYNGMESYKNKLVCYARELCCSDIIFTGGIRFDEILAYYKLADGFICMSEHEGFCVPLIEAMKFQIPILAYDSCAVGETLGDGGILVREKSPLFLAKLMEEMIFNPDLNERIMQGQKENLKRFRYSFLSSEFKMRLRRFIRGGR